MNYAKRRRSASYSRRVRRKPSATRRRTRVQRRRRGRKSSIRRSIPDFTMVALPFSETRKMTSLNAHPGTTVYSYRLNALFQPQFQPPGGGTQPLGFDQYAAFFQKYRVHATKYHITWFDPSSVNGIELRVGTYVAPDGTQIPPGQQFSIFNELPNARNTHLSVAPGMSWRAKLSGFQRLCRLQGVTKADYNGDDDYESEFQALPAKSPMLHLYAWNPKDAVDNATVYYEIKMTFYASLFKRKPLTQST